MFFNSSREAEFKDFVEENFTKAPTSPSLEKHRENVKRAIDLMPKLSDNDFLKYMDGYANLIKTISLIEMDKE